VNIKDSGNLGASLSRLGGTLWAAPDESARKANSLEIAMIAVLYPRRYRTLQPP
jgi:hypothetical protein